MSKRKNIVEVAMDVGEIAGTATLVGAVANQISKWKVFKYIGSGVLTVGTGTGLVLTNTNNPAELPIEEPPTAIVFDMADYNKMEFLNEDSCSYYFTSKASGQDINYNIWVTCDVEVKQNYSYIGKHLIPTVSQGWTAIGQYHTFDNHKFDKLNLTFNYELLVVSSEEHSASEIADIVKMNASKRLELYESKVAINFGVV